MRHRFFAIGFDRDHRCAATCGDCIPDVVTVITAICQEHASGWQIIIDQRIEAFEVGDLSAK